MVSELGVKATVKRAERSAVALINELFIYLFIYLLVLAVIVFTLSSLLPPFQKEVYTCAGRAFPSWPGLV